MQNFDQEIQDIVNSMDIPIKDHDLMIGSIYENLKLRVGIRMSSILNEEQLEQLEKTAQKDNDDDIFILINKYIPGADKLIQEELDQIKRELLPA